MTAIARHPLGAACLISLLLVALSAVMAVPAIATEGGGTSYPLGVATINPGIEPLAPGLIFLSYNNYTFASHFRDARGGDALPGYHVSLAVTAFRFDYTLPRDTLPPGWLFGFHVIQPVFDTELYVRAPGRKGVKNSAFGLGDTTITPFVLGYVGNSNWFGKFGTKLKLPFVVPSGDYDKSLLLNKGRNYLSFEPQYGIQFFPRPDVTFGTNITWIYNWENPSTNYTSGQEIAVEPVAEYSPVKSLWFGVQGYYYRQLTADRVRDEETLGGRFGTAFAVGPQVRYSTPGFGVTAKWQHEFWVRNRSDGERLWIQMVIPLI